MPLNNYTSQILDFMPKPLEGFLFVIICIIVIIIVNLIHYTSIQQRVKSDSRCNTSGSDELQKVYKVMGTSMSNKDIFEVIYDFTDKKFTVNQLCKTGDVMNNITFPIYNMTTYQVEEISKIFPCEQNFKLENGANIIYKGATELVLFMQFLNTDFFEKRLF